MKIFKNIKSTYKYAKDEFKKDLRANPKTSKAIDSIKSIKSNIIKKPKIMIKKGKKLNDRRVVSDLKKKVGLRANHKKAKYKRKSMRQIRGETFNIRL
jgi:hypothetical protein